jgi:gliding motility-associated-like protein
MKKIVFLLLFIIELSPSNVCKSQTWIASTKINASEIEPRYSVIDNQNNLFILSYFTDTIYSPINIISYGVRDLLVTKINSSGSVIWNKRIGNVSTDVTGGIAIDNNGNIYISGTYYDHPCRFTGTDSLLSKGGGDIFIAKYSNDGSFIWAKRVSSAKTLESSFDLRFDGNNRLLMCGFFKDSLVIGSTKPNIDTLLGSSFNSNFIAAFDLDANIIWAKKFLGTNNLTRFRRIDISQNGYYFGGYFQGNVVLDIGTITSYVPTTYDAFIYKTDFNGNGQWVRRFRGSGTENFRTLTTDEFDNVYVLGNYNSPTIFVDSTESIVKTFTGNSGGYDTFIGKYNRSGVLQWFIRKGSSGKDIYNDFVVRNNVIYATGYFGNQLIFNQDTLKVNQSNISDVFLAAFNEIGNPIGGISMQGSDIDKVTAINNAGTIINMDASSRAYISGYYRSRQIKIGSQTYTSTNKNRSDLFFAIYQHPLLAVFTRHVNVTCNGLSDGLLQVTPYFGKSPYTYTWSHDANLHTNTAVDLPAGRYTVTVTDASNATTNIFYDISQPTPLVINDVTTPVSCHNGNNGAIDITVTGGTKKTDYSYFWTTLDGSGIVPLQQDQTGLTDGTYTITVKDDNQCAATRNIFVDDPAQFNFSGTVITNIVVPTTNGAVDLHVTGGNAPYNFQWTGPGGFTAATEDIAGLTTAGLYDVAITDSKNCIADTSMMVNDGTTMIASISDKTDVLCFGDNNGSATVSVVNGLTPYSYHWSDGLVTPLALRTNMAPGPYQVLVSDAATPVAHTAQASVTINGPASGLNLLLNVQNLRCYHDSTGVINLTVSGGTLPYQEAWNTGYTGEDLVNVASGSYSVTVTDGNNCVAHGNADITEPGIMAMTIDTAGLNLCFGDHHVSATANPTGGSGLFSFVWDDPGAQTTQTAFELGEGLYHVIATDQNNCQVSASVQVIAPDSLSIQTTLTDPACAGEANGAISPTVTGGTFPYDYAWSNNVFVRANTNIPAGPYNLVVTDNNSCIKTIDYVLNDPLPVTINRVDSINPSCFALANGSVTINASGGTGILEYSADNGQQFFASPVIGMLGAGSYTVVARDANDCISPGRTVSLIQPLEVIIDTVMTTNATCYGNSDGSVAISATGGTGVYQYSGDDGANYIAAPTIGSLSPGNYQIRVKDDSNCVSAAYPVVVGPSQPFIIDTTLVEQITPSRPVGAITLESTGGTLPVSYVIVPDSSSNTNGTFVNLPANSYRLFAYDAGLCRSNDLQVLIHEGITTLIIYDAFSPNNDGKNDVWHIGNIANYPRCKVKIFNVWGVAVFSSTGYGDPWDGKYNGNDLPAGTYYYVIDPGDGSAILSGPVSIVK